MAPNRKTYYEYCFNPFKLEKHGKKSAKNLRPVLPGMLRKLNMKNVPLSADKRICDYCRLKISKMPEIISETSDGSSHTEDLQASSSAEVRLPDSDKDLPPTERNFEVDIARHNESLREFGASPIDKRKLRHKKYPQQKIGKLQETLTSKVFQIEGGTELEDETQNVDPIETLKTAFRTTDDRSKKVQILTIFQSWSFAKIRQNFAASNQMISVAKRTAEERGILSSPNGRAGKKIDKDTENCVVNFYTSDYMSRLMAGKKNYISVRENGEKVRKQKRSILTNLKETYRMFQEKHPDLKVGFSKFCELRPKHCVLSGASGTHSVCVCLIHENVKLMLDGAGIAKLTADTTQPIKNYKDCLARMMCSPPTTECHLKECKNCPGTENLVDQLQQLLESEFIDTVTYRQWISADRTNLEIIQTPVEEFLEKLEIKLKGLGTHAFIAEQQSAYFLELKDQLQPGECLVVCDFAENYAFVVQDVIQGISWNNDQVTLHPFVAYCNQDGTIKHRNYVAISECLKHDTVAVHLFQRHFINFIKREFREVNKIIYFSDGASAQYKNKKNFLNLCLHQEDFGVSAVWHFFATSHGTGPCDRVGGAIKRLAAQSSLEPLQEPINTAKKFFTWANNNRNIKNIHVEFFTNEDYRKETVALQPRFLKAKLVPGTLTFHCIEPISTEKLLAKRYSKAKSHITAFASK